MDEETKEDIILVLQFVGMFACAFIIVGVVTMPLWIDSFDDFIYEGPEGHCERTGNTVTCYNNNDAKICEYKYNYKEDGHWC